MTLPGPLVLVVGAASRDITTDDPRGWRLGGAAAYGALALARLGVRVRAVIGVDDLASKARELDHLRAAGAQLHLVPIASGPVFENIEQIGGRRQRCLAAADAVPLDGLPATWATDLDGLFLAPVSGELGAAWGSLRAPDVALGWQGLLRELEAGRDVTRRAPAEHPLLAAASLVGASRDDFEPGTTVASLARLLPAATTLVLTEGECGGRTLRTGPNGRAGNSRRYPAIPSDRTIDPTGAGDVFLAAMLAARLGAPRRSAVRFAAAAASLVVEATGLAGVPDLAAVRARMTRAPSRSMRRPRAVSSRARGRPSQA